MSRGLTAAVILVLSALAFQARAGPPMSSGTEAVVRSAVSAGGGARAASGANAIEPLIGEEVASTTAPLSGVNLLGAGYIQIHSFPGAVADLAARPDVSVSSASLVWSSPGYDGGLGALQSGSTYFIRVASFTSPNTFSDHLLANISFSTSGVVPGASVSMGATGLLANTTYWARLWTIDAAGNLSYASNVSTFVTLALPPSPGLLQFLSIQRSSVAVAWAAMPASPPEETCEGYILRASSNNFGALTPPGAPVFSSVTYSFLASTLTVGSPSVPLDLANTYYFMVGSLNHSGQANYTQLQLLNFQIDQSTGLISLGNLDPQVERSTVSTSSMVVTNVGNWPVTIELSASTATTPSSPWTLSLSSGIETVVLMGVWNSGPPAPAPAAFNTDLTTTTRPSQVGGNYAGDENAVQIPVGQSRTLWFHFWLPTSTASPGAETIQVAAQPVYP